ncbi:MAG: type I glyceraldehyde-3-phosphate dehydrogenase [Granulosicoccus sp.]|nr:type I glyceraldehyde-3-phosphate dehydrogenase [Granulosicoccus sp.]
MKTKLAINGFGRIGRNIFRAWIESGRKDLEIVAINDLAPVEMQAHLLQFDSVHGRLNLPVQYGENWLQVGKHRIRCGSERNPEELEWHDVDVTLECTGFFTAREAAARHLKNGSSRVLVSAPSKGADKTIVYGVNHRSLESSDLVVSNASCTTNCLAPIAMVLDQHIGIENGYMTTIHSYTGDQPTLDTNHADPYRARAAAMSMIPTSTGAARAVGLVLPNLQGKLDGSAIRVPTPNVSVVDLSFTTSRDTNVDEINDLFAEASQKELVDILDISRSPLVSSDFNHIPYSSIVAANETKVLDERFVRVLSWYDNEWGFSNRMLDTAAFFDRVVKGNTSIAA